MTNDYTTLDYDKNNVWHIVPTNDVKPHITRIPICHCNPKLEIQENGGLIVKHNSLDGREYQEVDNEKYGKTL